MTYAVIQSIYSQPQFLHQIAILTLIQPPQGVNSVVFTLAGKQIFHEVAAFLQISFSSMISLYFAACIYPHKPSQDLLQRSMHTEFLIRQKTSPKNYIKSTLIHCFRTMKHEIHFFICTLCASEQHRVLTVLCHYQGHMNCLCQGRTQLHTQTHCTEPHLFHSAAFALFLLIQIDSSCH